MPLPKAADDLINEFFDPQDSFYLEPIIKSNLLTTAEKYILFRAVLASPEPPPPPDEKKRTPEEQHLAQAQAAQAHFFPYLDWLYLIDPPGELVASFKTLHDFLHNTEVHRGYDGQGAVLAIKHFFGGLLGNNLSPQVTTKIQHAVRRKVNDYLITLNIKALSKELGDAKQAMNEGCIDWRFLPDTGHLLNSQASYRMPASVHTNIYSKGKDNLPEILNGASLKFPKGVRYFTGVLQTSCQILPFKECSISLLYTTDYYNAHLSEDVYHHLDQALAHLSEDAENRIQLLRYCLEFYFLDVIQNTSPASKEKTLATIFQNLKTLKQLEPDDEFGVMCHDAFEFYQEKFEGSEDKLNALDLQSVAYRWLLLNRGAAYSQQKKFDLAIDDFDRLLEQLIEVNFYYNIARTLRGNAYLQQKKFEAAIIDFNGALEINPINIIALVGRGEIYLQRKNYDAAIKDLSAVLQINPKDVSALAHRGLAYHQKKEYDLAIADFTHTLQIDHNNAVAFANRGEAYYQQNKFDLAIVEFTHALTIKPNSATWLADRGWVYRLQGKLDLAINDSEQALKSEPQNRNALATCRKAYYARGIKYFQDKKYDLAIADFTRVLQIEPNDFFALSNRGIAHHNKCEDDLAITDLTHALQIDPNHVHTLYIRGLTYSRQEEYNLAISDFTSLLQINPNNTTAFRERVKIYYKQERFDLAIVDLTSILYISPTTDEFLLMERAELYVGEKKFDLALADLTLAIQCAKPDCMYPPYPLLRRGEVYLEKGEFDLAIADFNQYVVTAQNYSNNWLYRHVLSNRGVAYRQKKEFDLAIADFTRALEIKPNDPLLLAELEKTRRQQKEAKEALDLAMRDFFQDFSADCVRELEMSNTPVQANLVENQSQPKAVSLSPKQEEKKEEEGLEIDANCSPSFVMTAKVGAYPYGCNQPMDGSPLGQGRQANGQQAVAAKEEKSDRAHRSSSRRKKEKSDRIHRSSSQRKKEKPDRTHHSSSRRKKEKSDRIHHSSSRRKEEKSDGIHHPSSRRKEENPDRVHRQSSRRRAHTSSFGHSNLFKPPSAPREKDGFVWVEKEKRKQTIVDNNYVLVETDMAINGLDAGKNYSCVIL